GHNIQAVDQDRDFLSGRGCFDVHLGEVSFEAGSDSSLVEVDRFIAQVGLDRLYPKGDGHYGDVLTVDQNLHLQVLGRTRHHRGCGGEGLADDRFTQHTTVPVEGVLHRPAAHGGEHMQAFDGRGSGLEVLTAEGDGDGDGMPFVGQGVLGELDDFSQV